MTVSSNTNASQRTKEARKRVVDLYKRAIGYQPMRMKPVHFATSFLLCLHGKYRTLELLNKAANPKAVEKSPGDPYVSRNLFELLNDSDNTPLGEAVTEQEFAILRTHLNQAFNNDGAALAPGFKPYSTFGFDFSTPAPDFLANASKNHGNSGALMFAILGQSANGRAFIDCARKIFDRSQPPAAILGRPFVEENTDDYTSPENLLPGDCSNEFLVTASKLMEQQTDALLQLAKNIETGAPAYALRQLIIGAGSWLLLFMIKKSVSQSPVILIDYSSGRSARLRTQAKACFARHISQFGSLIERLIAEQTITADTDEQSALIDLKDIVSKEFEEHFNDFSVRIGWAQPRAGNVKQKHFEIVPDTLKVLLLSVLSPDEVITMDELAGRLLKAWGVCVGLVPTDHALLNDRGFSPLDHDADIRMNRECFKRLAIAIGLAREPSDGLVLFSLSSTNG